jgi:hypothetical protein
MFSEPLFDIWSNFLRTTKKLFCTISKCNSDLTTCNVGNPGPSLGQSHRCGWVDYQYRLHVVEFWPDVKHLWHWIAWRSQDLRIYSTWCFTWVFDLQYKTFLLSFKIKLQVLAHIFIILKSENKNTSFWLSLKDKKFPLKVQAILNIYVCNILI